MVIDCEEDTVDVEKFQYALQNMYTRQPLGALCDTLFVLWTCFLQKIAK